RYVKTWRVVIEALLGGQKLSLRLLKESRINRVGLRRSSMSIRAWLAMMFAVVMVGLIGCGQQEAPKTSTPSAPAAPSKSVTDSTGQAVIDSIKAPLET